MGRVHARGKSVLSQLAAKAISRRVCFQEAHLQYANGERAVQGGSSCWRALPGWKSSTPTRFGNAAAATEAWNFHFHRPNVPNAPLAQTVRFRLCGPRKACRRESGESKVEQKPLPEPSPPTIALPGRAGLVAWREESGLALNPRLPAGARNLARCRIFTSFVIQHSSFLIHRLQSRRLVLGVVGEPGATDRGESPEDRTLRALESLGNLLVGIASAFQGGNLAQFGVI